MIYKACLRGHGEVLGTAEVFVWRGMIPAPRVGFAPAEPGDGARRVTSCPTVGATPGPTTSCRTPLRMQGSRRLPVSQASGRFAHLRNEDGSGSSSLPVALSK